MDKVNSWPKKTKIQEDATTSYSSRDLPFLESSVVRFPNFIPDIPLWIGHWGSEGERLMRTGKINFQHNLGWNSLYFEKEKKVLATFAIRSTRAKSLNFEIQLDHLSLLARIPETEKKYSQLQKKKNRKLALLTWCDLHGADLLVEGKLRQFHHAGELQFQSEKESKFGS